MRDDFPIDIKRALALRVGHRCSRPECGASTSGPQTDPSKSVNVGVAAHISAASKGGPRFDPSLSPEARGSIDNGIWLCQNCAKLIDNDPAYFTPEVLRAWKLLREVEAKGKVGLASGGLGSPQGDNTEPKRQLVVELYVGEFVDRDVGSTPKFIFKVANPGQRPVTVWGAGVDALESDVHAPVLVPQLVSFPQEVGDGQGFMFMSDIDYFAAQLRAKGIKEPIQVVGYVSDALGNHHVSNATTFPS